MQIVAEPLTAEAFASFGQVLDYPQAPGRMFFNRGLVNARSQARVDLSVARLPPLAHRTLRAEVMERHEHSSQTFLPIDAARYLVVVAAHGEDGRPDASTARAFVGGGDQAVTYHRDIWHHGMTVLDRPGSFVVLMWCTGTGGDEEFFRLRQPFDVVLAPSNRSSPHGR